MPKRLALTLAILLIAAPALAGAPVPALERDAAAPAARPISESVQIGVGGYYGHPYGYRYGHWGYPAWSYDPWPRTAFYYGPPRRWWNYPPPQPLWNGSAVLWLHPAPPAAVAP